MAPKYSEMFFEQDPRCYAEDVVDFVDGADLTTNSWKSHACELGPSPNFLQLLNLPDKGVFYQLVE